MSENRERRRPTKEELIDDVTQLTGEIAYKAILYGNSLGGKTAIQAGTDIIKGLSEREEQTPDSSEPQP